MRYAGWCFFPAFASRIPSGTKPYSPQSMSSKAQPMIASSVTLHWFSQWKITILLLFCCLLCLNYKIIRIYTWICFKQLIYTDISSGSYNNLGESMFSPLHSGKLKPKDFSESSGWNLKLMTQRLLDKVPIFPFFWSHFLFGPWRNKKIDTDKLLNKGC